LLPLGEIRCTVPLEETLLRAAAAVCVPSTARYQDPAMPTNTTSLPDFSVDFLSWINAELRKQIEQTEDEIEQARNAGLVNKLRAYISDRLTTTVHAV
jgi:hypothetical protein